MRLVYAFSFLVLFCSSALAGAPQRIPLQGFLTDSASVPIDTTKQVTFAIYDVATGGTALYSESQAVVVIKGDFTVNVGANVPLDLKLFRNGSLYLGITIQGEAEMSPRLAFGTVPYAAYAEETGAVPPGAVMMFDLDACPPGWSALDAARGRAIVGVPTGGMRGGTVGTALTDKEDRAHSHSVDPAACTTSSDGVHAHTTDPVSTTSTSTSTDHIHTTISGTSTPQTGLSGAHSHVWANYNTTSLAWTSGAGVTMVDWTNGIDSGVNQTTQRSYPIQFSAGGNAHTDQEASHSHHIPSLTTTTAGGTHTHNVDIPGTLSTNSGGHTHTCDAAATASTATTSGVPYIQLLICRKD